jgi:TonB family protein
MNTPPPHQLHHAFEVVMPDTHASRLAACAFAFVIALSSAPAAAQPSVDAARKLYLGAQYEESLALLTQLHGETTAEQNEIATYQVFCLVALGRTEEAGRTIETIVSADPFYQPAEDLTSPRIRDVFRHTRRKVLPGIAKREYAAAKLAFDRKDPSASVMFERVLKLLGDPDVDAPAVGDLRVLAEGFRDLSRTFAAAPASGPGPTVAQGASPSQNRPSTTMRAEGSQAPPSVNEAPRESAPATSTAPARADAPAAAVGDPLAVRAAREGDPGVVPPVAISQTMPRWLPPAGVERTQEFDGVIEVLIDAQGSVTSATIRASVHPQYDPQLLRMARSWKFKPATRNGKPLAYAKLVEVRLKPATR